jgi:glutathione S-transferase
LAKKVDKNHVFGFEDDLERSEALQWLFFGMAGVGPMQGQLNHFSRMSSMLSLLRFHRTRSAFWVSTIHKLDKKMFAFQATLPKNCPML